MGLFAFEQIGKTIALCLATNPKEYMEQIYDNGKKEFQLKHKGKLDYTYILIQIFLLYNT